MIKIEASKEEIQALLGLIDAGLRSVGLRGAKEAFIWSEKIATSLKEDNDG